MGEPLAAIAKMEDKPKAAPKALLKKLLGTKAAQQAAQQAAQPKRNKGKEKASQPSPSTSKASTSRPPRPSLPPHHPPPREYVRKAATATQRKHFHKLFADLDQKGKNDEIQKKRIQIELYRKKFGIKIAPPKKNAKLEEVNEILRNCQKARNTEASKDLVWKWLLKYIARQIETIGTSDKYRPTFAYAGLGALDGTGVIISQLVDGGDFEDEIDELNIKYPGISSFMGPEIRIMMKVYQTMKTISDNNMRSVFSTKAKETLRRDINDL